jgi:hypothetical protein
MDFVVCDIYIRFKYYRFLINYVDITITMYYNTINTYTIDDFQYLCNHCNLQNRQVSKLTM